VDRKLDARTPPRGFPIPILALTISAFAIGTAEFVIAGLLPDISHDLGVSIPAAGQLVTAYAMGVVVGAPALAIVTSKLRHKTVLLAMLGIFIFGNLLSAIAPTYALLMTARVIAALAHGSLFGVGVVVAADLVAPDRRASAVALMFTGLTVANIAGVPLGTLVGQLYGWRMTFLAITSLGVLSLAAVVVLIPSASDMGAIDVRREFAVARRPQVLLALATTGLGWGCVFVLFTYIVPILEEISGFSPPAVTVILFIIGVGLTIGINIGGKLADRGVMRALIGMLIALAALSALFTLASHQKVAAVVVIFLWGMAAFGTIPALQTRVLDSAREAPNIASALNAGAFNLGNAGGAFLGGLIIDWGLGLDAVPIGAAMVALAGLAIATLGAGFDRRRLRIIQRPRKLSAHEEPRAPRQQGY
jgi:MFS transporter, DHA1 family, inner membrane transport protein